MKFKALLAILVLIIAVAAPAFAQYGETDTLIIMTTRPEAGADDSTFAIELWLWHDEPVSGIQSGFEWDFAGLHADSAVGAPVLYANWNTPFLIFWDGGNINTSNTTYRFSFTGVGLLGGDLPVVPSRELICTWYFTVSGWDASSAIIIDTNTYDVSVQLLVLADQDQIAPSVLIPDMPIYVRDPSGLNSGGSDELPMTFGLSQNYPNPFNPTTKIEFTMPKAVPYELTIYNVLGQVVQEFSDQGKAGVNTVTWDASGNGSGIYFYKLKAGDFTETRKMALVK